MNDSRVYGPVLNAAYVAATTGTIAKKKNQKPTTKHQETTKKIQDSTR